MATLPSYAPQSLPLIPGGAERYTQNELQRLRAVLGSYREMLPQAATKAPLSPVDGMRRLARNPWRPVAGQTADAWVYWDAAGNVWRYDSTAPTNT